MKKAAVILSGCGVFDGSEIHESVILLLTLEQENISYQCFAPNIEQTDVVNHLTNEPMTEKRNVLVEAARITRGNIKDIKEANADDFDCAFYPGGFGAAKNLSDFAANGPNMTINADVLRFATAMKTAGKPQGFTCITPALITKIYGPGVAHTIGKDSDTAAAINAMGGKHVDCSVDEIVIDQQHKVVSTPAYMLANKMSDFSSAFKKLVKQTIKMAD